MYKINSIDINKYRNNIRLLAVFLIACVAFSIPFGYEYSKKINVLIFVLWLFIVRIEDIKYILKNKVLIVLFLFIVSHYTTLFLSEDISSALYEIRHFWRYIFIPIIMYMTIIKKGDIKYIISAFIISMFINEIISYLIYFDLYQTEFSKTRQFPVGFINHIQYSVLVAFSSILILYQAKGMKNGIVKYIYVVFFITMTTNLVISSGRTGYVIFFVSLIILLVVYYKFTWKNFLQILLFPTIVFFIGYKLNAGVEARIKASLTAIDKIGEESNYNTSLGTRIAYYPLTYDMLSQKENSFIFGVGMGDIQKELIKSIKRTDYIKIGPLNIQHVHSSYLTAYLNAGILGLILLILLFYYLFSMKFENKEYKFIKYLFLLNFSIGIIPDILLTQKIMMVYFSIFVALILAQQKAEYEDKLKKK
ncbi:MAG: O-antigen ligase family protein [Thiovulaceae bacterium]|nr:O-antigen ligase family protein [Sulfurimonadaceae bacterium]